MKSARSLTCMAAQSAMFRPSIVADSVAWLNLAP